MEILNITKELAGNSYPGRGIVIGKNKAGTHAVTAYFIMGRSVNSRNRVFETDGEGIRTEAFDPALLEDPSLVIYAPVRVFGNDTVVTNGDQTDTVYEFLKDGKSFEDALRTRTFEPDPPNFTPRISGIMHMGQDGFTYQMSILKSSMGEEGEPQRFFFDYSGKNGLGHFIHTYKCDGNPAIPSFEGEPKPVCIDGDINSFSKSLWEALNEENKVSLFVRYISLADNTAETRIINKNN